MMKTMTATISMTLCALLLWQASPVLAACQWRWDCTRGACRQVSLCDQALELPPLRPLELPPLPPIPPIPPLPTLALPPLGTSSCQQRYLCQGMACGWHTVCQ